MTKLGSTNKIYMKLLRKIEGPFINMLLQIVMEIVIDTSFGNYFPDWAVVYRLDEEKAGIDFIVETK